jgi:hypothetical protein
MFCECRLTSKNAQPISEFLITTLPKRFKEWRLELKARLGKQKSFLNTLLPHITIQEQRDEFNVLYKTIEMSEETIPLYTPLPRNVAPVAHINRAKYLANLSSSRLKLDWCLHCLAHDCHLSIPSEYFVIVSGQKIIKMLEDGESLYKINALIDKWPDIAITPELKKHPKAYLITDILNRNIVRFKQDYCPMEILDLRGDLLSKHSQPFSHNMSSPFD